MALLARLLTVLMLLSRLIPLLCARIVLLLLAGPLLPCSLLLAVLVLGLLSGLAFL